MRKLGPRQLDILKTLAEFKTWRRYLPAWVWVYASQTETVLESLAKRGLADRTSEGFAINDAGKAYLEKHT